MSETLKRPVNCESCNKSEAVVHLTNIVGGQMEKLRLCGPCAAARGFVVEPPALGAVGAVPEKVDQILSQMLEALQTGMEVSEQRPAEPEAACPDCGMTLSEFQKRGRLGCANDYIVFEDEMNRLLTKIHGANVHVGALPAKARERQGRRRFVKERIEALKKELDAAVHGERFEEAAGLRDRLRELERAEESSS